MRKVQVSNDPGRYETPEPNLISMILYIEYLSSIGDLTYSQVQLLRKILRSGEQVRLSGTKMTLEKLLPCQIALA